MILDAYEKYNLIGKIKQLLPSYNFNMTVHANNAVRIKNVRERFQRTLARESYLDGVIIMTGKYFFVNSVRTFLLFID